MGHSAGRAGSGASGADDPLQRSCPTTRYSTAPRPQLNSAFLVAALAPPKLLMPFWREKTSRSKNFAAVEDELHQGVVLVGAERDAQGPDREEQGGDHEEQPDHLGQAGADLGGPLPLRTGRGALPARPPLAGLGTLGLGLGLRRLLLQQCHVSVPLVVAAGLLSDPRTAPCRDRSRRTTTSRSPRSSRGEQRRELLALDLQPGVEVDLEAPVDGLLGRPHGVRRRRARTAAPTPPPRRTPASAGNDPVDQPDGQRLVGLDEPAGEDQVLGAARARPAGSAAGCRRRPG